MRVMDLLEDSALDVELRAPVPPDRLNRTITACAQTELMDPTPFLSRGEFVLTLGMGLHFVDARTWDAYVERLIAAGASGLGFGLGTIHMTTPIGLVGACERQGLPLVELDAGFPLVKLSRHIWEGLAAERYQVARRGWDLANECTQLATEGAAPAVILERVAERIGGNAALVDPAGFTLARAGDLRFEPGAGSRTTLALPGGERDGFHLRLETEGDAVLLQPLLGPTAAVLAMQLSYTLAARSPLHSHSAARFIEALSDRRGVAPEVLRPLAVDAGFAPDDTWDAVVLRRPEAVSSAVLRLVTWRLRVLLEEKYRCVRFYDEAYQATLVMQGVRDSGDLSDVLRSAVDRAEGIDAGYTHGIALDELSIVIQVARRAEPVAGVHPLPIVDLGALVGALPNAGLTALARRTLGPLLDGDGVLYSTLEAYLELGGSAKLVCQRLFIHRNTLSYRLQRIEHLLGVDLGDGRARATLLFALEIVSGR